MSRSYPVVVASTEDRDAPHSLGLFGQTGYWHSVAGNYFEFGPEHAVLAQRVANAINLAYEDGQRNTRNRLRDALGLDWTDE